MCIFADHCSFRLTPKFLRQHCKDLKLYLTPQLNDVLYLHYKGTSIKQVILKCIKWNCFGSERLICPGFYLLAVDNVRLM